MKLQQREGQLLPDVVGEEHDQAKDVVFVAACIEGYARLLHVLYEIGTATSLEEAHGRVVAAFEKEQENTEASKLALEAQRPGAKVAQG